MMPYIYYYNNKGEILSKVDSYMVSFHTCDDNRATAISSEGSIYHCKLIDGTWMLHCEDGPASIQGNDFWFFYDGVNYVINTLPVDGEVKLILTLKYSVKQIYGQFTVYTT